MSDSWNNIISCKVKYCGLDLLQQIFKCNPPELNGTQVMFWRSYKSVTIYRIVKIRTFKDLTLLFSTFLNDFNCLKLDFNINLTLLKKSYFKCKYY